MHPVMDGTVILDGGERTVCTKMFIVALLAWYANC